MLTIYSEHTLKSLMLQLAEKDKVVTERGDTEIERNDTPSIFLLTAIELEEAQ
jgi:hypothetical protein